MDVLVNGEGWVDFRKDPKVVQWTRGTEALETVINNFLNWLRQSGRWPDATPDVLIQFQKNMNLRFLQGQEAPDYDKISDLVIAYVEVRAGRRSTM